jgi:hypothetical protein
MAHSDMTPVERTISTAIPFRDQAELVEAELELTRQRIRFAAADRERRANGDATRQTSWPPNLIAAEAHVEHRVASTILAGADVPLVWLRGRLGLGTTELRLVWVLLAHEMCPIARTMLRELNTENCADPTTDTLRTVAFGPGSHADAYRLLATSSPLVNGGLIERSDNDANAPDHRKTWKLARRVVALAHGDLSLDPDLFRIATVVRADESAHGIGGEGIEADADCLPILIAALKNGGSDRTVIVQGQRGTGRRSLLRVAAAECGLELLEVDLTRLSANPNVARNQFAAVARECRLFERVPLLRELDALVTKPGATSDDATPRPQASTGMLDLITTELEGLLVLATTSEIIPGNRLRTPQIIELPPLTALQRVRLWTRALPMLSLDDADQLTTMYPIAPSLIDAAATVARAQALALSQHPIHVHIRTGLRAALDGRLAGLAHRVETLQGWDSLVLPTDQREAIDELIARVRRRRTVYEEWKLGSHFDRGLGVSALFSGPPGTGKTMAAGLIANELSTDLYQVDMSKIVSKWLGETEKNLAALFEAAEAGHAILLFDEADALFGKRTEVKSSNDRHANSETNYLLQRLESFRGVCLLTTNNDTAIDEAFRRRISLHVHFPIPELQERVRLWRTMLRPTIPVQGQLDLQGLASRYEMSGGHIKNAVLRAAFFAADAGGPVTNQHLFRAAALEYHAMGRIMPSSL